MQVWDRFLARLMDPMRFRFILQPLAAILLGLLGKRLELGGPVFDTNLPGSMERQVIAELAAERGAS